MTPQPDTTEPAARERACAWYESRPTHAPMRRRFSPEEDAILMAAYAKGGLAGAQAALPTRGVFGLRQRLEVLGARKRPVKAMPHWKGAELAIVRSHFAAEGLAGCMARLPGRSRSAIERVARQLGLTRPKAHPNRTILTEKQQELLRQVATRERKYTLKVLAQAWQVPLGGLKKEVVRMRATLTAPLEIPEHERYFDRLGRACGERNDETI